jgi:hypothetical protein
MVRDILPVTVVAATSGGGIELPWRYVVLKWEKGSSAHPFSRHMQVKDVRNEFNDQIFYYGHYCCTYQDAFDDMVESMRENNNSFGFGNVSHIPGIDCEITKDVPVDIVNAYTEAIKLHL